MEQNCVLSNILKNVFESLTTETTNFVDWYDYKTMEVTFGDTKESVGIGINANFTAIKTFYINKSYADYRKFTQTFRIGSNNANNGCWGVELAAANLNAPVGEMSFISNHIQIIQILMNLIAEEETRILKQS